MKNEHYVNFVVKVLSALNFHVDLKNSNINIQHETLEIELEVSKEVDVKGSVPKNEQEISEDVVGNLLAVYSTNFNVD